jgi:subfamily B ATP-binding cassette protein MsbA
MSPDVSREEKLQALKRLVSYRPVEVVGIVGLSVLAAVLEGFGLSFILPIVELARGGGGEGRFFEMFVLLYDFLGIPLTLEWSVVGVSAVMLVRYTSSFLVSWLRASLRTDYLRHLQSESFDRALAAETAYFDQNGSENILNAIVTQAKRAAHVIEHAVKITELVLLSLVYLSVALILSPILTAVTIVALGGMTVFIRRILEPAYTVGDRVADANEEVQTAVQAGVQGIRDVKMFRLERELYADFEESVDSFARSQVKLLRNKAAMKNLYQLATSVTLFGLIYIAITFTSLSLADLGVFLFAMFRLAPRASAVNDMIYDLEGNLPHLVRTQQFITELEDSEEPSGGEMPVPDRIETVEYDDIEFTYEDGTQVLDGLSVSIDRGEFVAFVGPSGAGKSTVVSLLTRLYEPDRGTITADGTPIDEFDLGAWRSQVAVVRQDPHVFNDTLRYNLTVGNRDVSDERLQRVCEATQVTEFLDGLQRGYETILGDDGVRLSGGQRQRVALARALLKDAELLVLDEATSDLDTNIEAKVHEAIESMERDRTMIVIAHRLSTVRNADQIYTLEDGTVVESGPHEQLLEAEGQYAELYASQRF